MPGLFLLKLEYTDNIADANDIVLLLHGLESNSRGNLITKQTVALLEKDFACILVSFRGCSGR